jgi:hypothetical protein
MTNRRMRSGGMLLGAALIEAEAIRDAKAEGQPSPPSSTLAVALVDKARTKLPSVSEVWVGGELVPCDMPDERSVALRNTVADPDYVAVDASRDRLELLHETGALELCLDAADTIEAENSLERMLAHQLASAHRSTLKMMAQLDRRLSVMANLSPPHPDTAALKVEACRLAGAAGRLMNSYQSGMLALEQMRSGGRQHVVVQYVHQHVQVSEGGQAMVAGQVKAGVSGAERKGRGAAKMDDDPPHPGARGWSEHSQRRAALRGGGTGESARLLRCRTGAVERMAGRPPGREHQRGWSGRAGQDGGPGTIRPRPRPNGAKHGRRSGSCACCWIWC